MDETEGAGLKALADNMENNLLEQSQHCKSTKEVCNADSSNTVQISKSESSDYAGDLIVALPKQEVANGHTKKVGEFVKQVSLPDRVKDIESSVPSDRSLPCTYVGNGNFFLSPYASSNTLSESMYTASEGLQRSRSGITSLSEYTDCLYRSAGNSLTKTPSAISSLDQLTFHSCHSNLKYLAEKEDIECLENALNEQKLKGMVQNGARKNKLNKKQKLFKLSNKRHKSEKKHQSDRENTNHIKRAVVKTKMAADSSVVIHGILKSSVSCDSNIHVDNKQALKKETAMATGGTKALLIKKVCINIRYSSSHCCVKVKIDFAFNAFF